MKTSLLEKIRLELRSQLNRLTKAAQDAHAAATDPGSKAEGKYDTRSLEASYLASGQARQVAAIAESLRIFESLSLPDFEPEDAVESGALVEIDRGGESEWFLLAPAAGGLEIEHQGLAITLLTPESQLYEALLGTHVGAPVGDLIVTEVL